jgi:hypothetical protein
MFAVEVIREYRFPMPFSVETYYKGERFTSAYVVEQTANTNTSVEVAERRPIENVKGGQYTKTIYNLGKSFPSFLQPFIPKDKLQLIEESWNMGDHFDSKVSCPYAKNRYEMTITTTMSSDLNAQNIFDLSPEDLRRREIVPIKISNETPSMCCYKLIKFKLNMFGSHLITPFFFSQQQARFTRFHNHMYDTKDKWVNKTIEEISEYEKSISQPCSTDVDNAVE